MSTPTLAEFSAALAASVEAQLARHPPCPDLADVLARARAIDEASIPEGLLSSIEEPRVHDAAERPDPALAAFAAALRERVETAAGERELAPVPAPPGSRPRRWVAPAAMLAVAAALLLGWAWARLGPTVLEAGGARDPMGAAGAQVEGDDDRRPFEGVEPSQGRSRPLEPAPEPRPEIDETTATPVDPEPNTEPAPTRVAPTLDELEARARERWAAGDLAEAEALLRRVARRAGKGSRAELAYGDLFAIAKQRGGPEALAGMWREYLRRFPRGRYADDASAGLCRRAVATDRERCWTDYLAAHPRGAHAGEAGRGAGSTESP